MKNYLKIQTCVTAAALFAANAFALTSVSSGTAGPVTTTPTVMGGVVAPPSTGGPSVSTGTAVLSTGTAVLSGGGTTVPTPMGISAPSAGTATAYSGGTSVLTGHALSMTENVNPMLKKCITPPTNTTPVASDYDCDPTPPSATNYATWTDRLFNPQGQELTGRYDSRGVRCADQTKIDEQCRFEYRVKFVPHCAAARTNSTGKCTYADAIEVWSYLGNDVIKKGNHAQIKFQSIVVGPVGMPAAPSIPITNIVAAEKVAFSCPSGEIVAGVDAYGNQICKKPEEQCRTVVDVWSPEVVDNGFTKALCNADEVVKNGSGRCDRGAVTYNGVLVVNGETFTRNWMVSCSDPTAGSATFTAQCCKTASVSRGYQGGTACAKLDKVDTLYKPAPIAAPNAFKNFAYGDQGFWPEYIGKDGSNIPGNTTLVSGGISAPAPADRPNVGDMKFLTLPAWDRQNSQVVTRRTFNEAYYGCGVGKKPYVTSTTCYLQADGQRNPLRGPASIGTHPTTQFTKKMIKLPVCDRWKNGTSVEVITNSEFLLSELFPYPTADDVVTDNYFEAYYYGVQLRNAEFKVRQSGQCCAAGREIDVDPSRALASSVSAAATAAPMTGVSAVSGTTSGSGTSVLSTGSSSAGTMMVSPY